jgi:hypothetical protein
MTSSLQSAVQTILTKAPEAARMRMITHLLEGFPLKHGELTGPCLLGTCLAEDDRVLDSYDSFFTWPLTVDEIVAIFGTFDQTMVDLGEDQTRAIIVAEIRAWQKGRIPSLVLEAVPA